MKITAQQAREISEGRLIARDGRLFSANNGERQSDGLVLHERHDDAGRIIREWTGPKAAWMNQFKGPVHLQLCISNDPKWSKAVADRIRSEFNL